MVLFWAVTVGKNECGPRDQPRPLRGRSGAIKPDPLTLFRCAEIGAVDTPNALQQRHFRSNRTHVSKISHHDHRLEFCPPPLTTNHSGREYHGHPHHARFPRANTLWKLTDSGAQQGPNCAGVHPVTSPPLSPFPIWYARGAGIVGFGTHSISGFILRPRMFARPASMCAADWNDASCGKSGFF